jgi:exopolyphosphatase/guanosine-5'-triphosphate,3'-diphosphate pyrophosphatase
MAVVKLAAILRVADALDRGHSQRVDDITLEENEDDLIIHCHHRGDISNERYGIDMKADMFEEVFGYRIVIA